MGWRLKPSDALIFDFFLQTRFQRWLGCASTSSLLGSVCLQLVTGWAPTLSRGKVFFTGNVTSWLALLCQRLHFLFYSRVFGVARATGWSKWKKVIKQPADRLYLLLLRIMATERVSLFGFFCFCFCVHIIWPKCQKMCTKNTDTCVRPGLTTSVIWRHGCCEEVYFQFLTWKWSDGASALMHAHSLADKIKIMFEFLFKKLHMGAKFL